MTPKSTSAAVGGPQGAEAEVAALRAEEAELRAVVDAPRRLYAVRARLLLLRRRAELAAQDEMAERADPTWPAKLAAAQAVLAEAEQELAAAEVEAQRRLMRQRDRRLNPLDRLRSGRIHVKHAMVERDGSDPALVAAQARRNEAAARVRALLRYPSEVAVRASVNHRRTPVQPRSSRVVNAQPGDEGRRRVEPAQLVTADDVRVVGS